MLGGESSTGLKIYMHFALEVNHHQLFTVNYNIAAQISACTYVTLVYNNCYKEVLNNLAKIMDTDLTLTLLF